MKAENSKLHDHHSHESCHSHCCGCVNGGAEERFALPRIIIGAVFFFVTVILAGIEKLPGNVYVISAAVTYIILGYDTVMTAVRNILRGKIFDECFLMTVSSLGAFIIGEYIEAAAVMLFYQVGEWLSDLAVDKSRKSISELMNIRPDNAHVLRDGEIVTVDPKEVTTGETVVVKVGERVPVDGVVVSGISTLDVSALSGESVPVSVDEGDSVLSGSVNLEGVIHIRASKTAKNSTAERIMELVEGAASNKSKSESFITKFARHYTPIVVLISLIVAVVPPLFVGEWSEWIRRGLVTLVISCPCALVISVPLTFFGGLGKASRSGILIKGGNYLEALSNTDTVVFDKTGTLTKGKFTLAEINPVDNKDEETLLEAAAAAEAMSNHPIAISVTEAYKKTGKTIDKDKITSVSEIAGRGVKAVYCGKTIAAGNYALIKEECREEIPEKSSVGTCLYIAENGKYLGSLIVSDVVKPDSADGIASLRKRGVGRIFMLTGDRKPVAEKISRELNIDGYKAELLPDGKLEEFNKIKKNSNGSTIFVGDGINDSPVLASADIGIAMGGIGSDVAIEASDIVLMTDEISKLSEGIDIARKTKRLVIENIVFSLSVKVVIMVLGAAGHADMWVAVFGDVGVMMAAVLNSLRILK